MMIKIKSRGSWILVALMRFLLTATKAFSRCPTSTLVHDCLHHIFLLACTLEQESFDVVFSNWQIDKEAGVKGKEV